MASDQYLIVLARSCIGSFRGEAHSESQASLPSGLPLACHGLSAQIGALRPLLCSAEMEFYLRNFTAVGAVMWPSWLVRRSRVDVHGAGLNRSFAKRVAWEMPAPYTA